MQVRQKDLARRIDRHEVCLSEGGKTETTVKESGPARVKLSQPMKSLVKLKLYPATQVAEKTVPFASDVAVPAWKRGLDLFITLLLLPGLLPLMTLIAVYIKCVSKGPVFFRQQRIGRGGRPFNCLKFRSMHLNADTVVHQNYLSELIRSDVPMRKLDDQDPRVIPYGRLLRASGLDELPQIINIIRGEMSYVGPRPCTPNEYAEYLPWHKERCNALPGLTGLWQVNGKNKTTFSEMMKLDIQYVRTKSLGLDLSILFKTWRVILEQSLEVRKSKKNQRNAARIT